MHGEKFSKGAAMHAISLISKRKSQLGAVQRVDVLADFVEMMFLLRRIYRRVR